MIARALITLTAAIALSIAASAQQPSPAPREAVGTSGTSPSTTPTTASSPAAAAPTRVAEPVRTDPKDYRIGPEDILDINVWRSPELSRERVPVRPDGKISHPLLNDIEVAGKTTNQVRAEIAERLIASNRLENPEVSVVVREIHSPKVSVSGNVRMPGLFELKSEATVLDMIAKAQGLNEFADRGSIKVIRRGQQGAINFRYNDAINGRNDANFFVQPGDVIVVQ
jgi:polysaccharide export outer membrane protein